MFQEQEEIDATQEVDDSSPVEEEDLGAVEEERSVILHLLSQLKLGMDLTRVYQLNLINGFLCLSQTSDKGFNRTILN